MKKFVVGLAIVAGLVGFGPLPMAEAANDDEVVNCQACGCPGTSACDEESPYELGEPIPPATTQPPVIVPAPAPVVTIPVFTG